jgi:hypothetical protein
LRRVRRVPGAAEAGGRRDSSFYGPPVRTSLILFGLTSSWSIIVVKSFLQTQPVELEEAAIIDGCNPDETIRLASIMPAWLRSRCCIRSRSATLSGAP